MDRAIPFVENAVKNDTPFFTTTWFCSYNGPHGRDYDGPFEPVAPFDEVTGDWPVRGLTPDIDPGSPRGTLKR